jgi:hypothetical protein
MMCRTTTITRQKSRPFKLYYIIISSLLVLRLICVSVISILFIRIAIIKAKSNKFLDILVIEHVGKQATLYMGPVSADFGHVARHAGPTVLL